MENHSTTKKEVEVSRKEVESKMEVTICPKCDAELKYIADKINHGQSGCGSASSRVAAMNKYLSNSNTVGRLRK